MLQKEQERENDLILKFDKQLELMKNEHEKTLETMRMSFEGIIARERQNEMKRDASMKENLEYELKSSLIQNVVAMSIEGLVSAVESRVIREETNERERKSWVEKKELEKELEDEKKKSDGILSKLVFVEEMVKERERLEAKEWSAMLGGGTDFSGDDIIMGGGRIVGGESKTGPILSSDAEIGVFPNEKTSAAPAPEDATPP